MLKRTLAILLLASAAAAASAVAATHLGQIGCLLEKTVGMAQAVTRSKPVQVAHHLELRPMPPALVQGDDDAVDDEQGRYYDERDLPFKPQRF